MNLLGIELTWGTGFDVLHSCVLLGSKAAELHNGEEYGLMNPIDSFHTDNFDTSIKILTLICNSSLAI